MKRNDKILHYSGLN
ncbi:hypothetical protein ACX9Z0_002477 [Escherichia coli]